MGGAPQPRESFPAHGATCWEVFSLGISPYPGIENHEILPLEGESANQLSIVTNCEIIASQLASGDA